MSEKYGSVVGILLPKIGITRACKNPRFAVAVSVACVRGLGRKDMLDSLADEAITTGDENNIRHVVSVWVRGRGGR